MVKDGIWWIVARAARAVGQTGDEGVDGIIDEDRLGLDALYVQAKKWEDCRWATRNPEIRGGADGNALVRASSLQRRRFVRSDKLRLKHRLQGRVDRWQATS